MLLYFFFACYTLSHIAFASLYCNMFRYFPFYLLNRLGSMCGNFFEAARAKAVYKSVID